MTLSELIAAYGDDKVQFQKLDESATKLGLVLWLDRKRVAEIITASKQAGTSK